VDAFYFAFSIFSNKGLNMACHILWVVGRY